MTGFSLDVDLLTFFCIALFVLLGCIFGPYHLNSLNPRFHLFSVL